MKQVILMRQDLKLGKGKMAAQASHASVEAVLKSDKGMIHDWQTEGMKKVVLRVKDEKELVGLLQKAKENGLVVSLITDAGRTEIPSGTKTCVGIGPDDDEKIDKITSHLKMI